MESVPNELLTDATDKFNLDTFMLQFLAITHTDCHLQYT